MTCGAAEGEGWVVPNVFLEIKSQALTDPDGEREVVSI